MLKRDLIKFYPIGRPLDSSWCLGALLWTIGALTKYRDQNVNNSSTMQPSAIDPSGATLLQTVRLYLPRHLH
jgi:hypothetical protein